MKKKIIIGTLLILALICLGVAIYFILRHFGITSVEGIRELVEKCGVWGWLAFMLLFIVVSVVLCFIPATSMSFIIVAIIMFGEWKALLISTVSVVIASSIMFFIGSTLGEKTAAKIVGADNLHKAQDLIDVKSKIFLPLMFLFPAFPDDALCLVAGMTKMKYWQFLLIVITCRTVGIAAICFLGSGLIDWTSLSLIDWYMLINVAAMDIFLAFKLSSRIEQRIKRKKQEKEVE